MSRAAPFAPCSRWVHPSSRWVHPSSRLVCHSSRQLGAPLFMSGAPLFTLGAHLFTSGAPLFTLGAPLTSDVPTARLSPWRSVAACPPSPWEARSRPVPAGPCSSICTPAKHTQTNQNRIATDSGIQLQINFVPKTKMREACTSRNWRIVVIQRKLRAYPTLRHIHVQ